MAQAKYSGIPAKTQVSRRNLLALAPVAAIVGCGQVCVAATVEDHHQDWLNEWRVVRQSWSDCLDIYGDETDESETLWARRMELEGLITGTPAKTDAGRLAQINWLLEDSGGSFIDIGHGAVVETLRKSYAA